MTMPKAAMNEDNRLILREDDIRGTWEAFDIRSVAETTSPEGETQLHLWFGGG